MRVFATDLLAGKVAWVTGGGSGIGETVARVLAAHGASVAITGRDPAKLAAVAGSIGDAALALPADVRGPDQVEAAVARIAEWRGRLDALVNGAAGNFLCPATALSPNGFGTVIDIDLKGTFHCSKAAFPLLSRAGGAIVNLSATLHHGGTPLQVHAASAKAGVDAMTRTLAVEWGPSGIRVNAVAPGPIADTPGMEKLAPGALGRHLASRIPLQRFGTREEVADAVLFLLSPAAAWITGAVLVVDGGQAIGAGALFDLAAATGATRG